jgi:hypothetical protein
MSVKDLVGTGFWSKQAFVGSPMHRLLGLLSQVLIGKP